MNTDSVSTPLSGVERKILLSVPLAILATAISIFGIFYYQVTMGVSHTVLERSGACWNSTAPPTKAVPCMPMFRTCSRACGS